MLSEDVLFALNEAKAADLEKTAQRLGYLKKAGKVTRIRRARRTLLFAAVIAALLIGSVAAATGGIFERVQHNNELDREREEQRRIRTEESGREYHEPSYMDNVDLTSIPTENDQVFLITDFTESPIKDKYEGKPFEPCRFHLLESYYDGKDLRLGIVFEDQDGNPMQHVDLSDSCFTIPGTSANYYLSDHFRLADGTELGPTSFELTESGFYLDFYRGLPAEAQDLDELNIEVYLLAHYDDSPEYARSLICFTVPNTAD